MSNWESEKYWENTGRSFNLDSDQSSKYKFDNIEKSSLRKHYSTKPDPSVSKTQPTISGYPVSILSESDLEPSQLMCCSCNNLITRHEDVKYDGNKIFTNDACWKHWIKKMVESNNFQIQDLVSYAAKKYFLDCICLTNNGQLIIKVILILKGVMEQYQFGVLLCENRVAYNHYMSFLRETRQTDDKLLRCSNVFEEPIKNLREIINDNYNVNISGVGEFIRRLNELIDGMMLNSSALSFQCEIIGEYVNLLKLQASSYQKLLNKSLIATVIETKLSHQVITDNRSSAYLKDSFSMTPEEFFWTALQPIVMQGRFGDIEMAINHKGFGRKPDILYERIVSFLYSMSKEPDELKMKCLLKISDVNDLIDCANLYGLFNHFLDYCQKNKESKVLKKIKEAAGK